MRPFTLGLSLALLGVFQNSASADTYNCLSKHFDSQEKPDEIVVNTDVDTFTFGFKVTSFEKHDGGEWTPKTEYIFSALSVDKPVSMLWLRCDLSHISNENEFAFNWSCADGKATASGHLNLNLQEHTGEIYSAGEVNSPYAFANRQIKFYGCTK